MAGEPRLDVTIAGVRFPTPLIVGSCSLTNSAEKILRLVDAGAGGVITKTISPEPLDGAPQSFLSGRSGRSFAIAGDPRVDLDDGCEMIATVRRSTDVPVIANVIGRSVDAEVWVPACQALEAAGATMLELDLNCHPEGDLDLGLPPTASFYNATSIGQDPSATAQVVRDVTSAVGIPVISKMTLRASDLLAVAEASAQAGAHVISGVNTMHGVADLLADEQGRPAIPGHATHSLSAVCGPDLALLGVKWTALISKYVPLPYVSGSGVTGGRDVIERLLLGAHAVTLCSALYSGGPGVIGTITQELREWLERVGAASVDEIRGLGAARLVASRDEVEKVPVVARVADQALWARSCEDVYERSELACECIGRDGGRVVFDEAKCTGCALPYLNAPAGAVEMVPAER